MARVFISHSSKNNELAAEVRGWLRADGHDVFLDYDRHDGIEGGDPWEERLHEGLRWADAVLCIVTSDYVISQWCFGEIVAAKTLGGKLVPLTAEKWMRHPLLDDLQRIAYPGAQPQEWDRICGILREIDAAGGAGWPDDRSPWENETVALWDITDRAHPVLITTLTGPTTYTSEAAFSPDGHTLAIRGVDTALWDLRGIPELSGHLTSRSCAAAGGGLAPEQWDTFAPGIPYRPTC